MKQEKKKKSQMKSVWPIDLLEVRCNVLLCFRSLVLNSSFINPFISDNNCVINKIEVFVD